MTFQEKMLNVEPINLFDYKSEIPEFRLLEKCPQDRKWHAEGDVLIHTNMVLEEAYKLCQDIKNPNIRQNIYFGSLLHDFGKPQTTFSKKNGKVVAYGHEGVGVLRAREFLRKHFPQFNFARREWILSLVEFHGHPKRMMNTGSKDEKFKKLSLDVNTLEVHHVEVADFTGRRGASHDGALKVLDDFQALCQRMDIWDKYYNIPNSEKLSKLVYNIARWRILFRQMDENDQQMFDKLKKFDDKEPFGLVMTIGVPGIGKTTYIDKIYSHLPKVSMDEKRAELGDIMDMSKNQKVFSMCQKELADNMRAGVNCVWDATSISRKMRKGLIDIVRQHGGYVSMVYFDSPLEDALERNSKRDRQVPKEVIEDYHTRLQSPKPYEYDRLVVVGEESKFQSEVEHGKQKESIR